MAFTFKTFTDIFTDIENSLGSNNSALSDLNTGSLMQVFVRSVTSAISLGWIGLAQLRELFYINSSSGTDLDRRVGDFGMIRNPGSFATGSILFYPLSSGQSVTKGDRIPSIDGTLTYEILNTTPIVASPTAVATVAISVGSAYNLPSGTKLASPNNNLQAVVGSALDNSNIPTGAISGGVDQETDDQMKVRFVDYLKSLSRGTKLAILQALRGTPGIGNVIVEEATPIPGWITVTAADVIGNLPQQTKDKVVQVLTDWGVAGMGYIIKSVTRTNYVVDVTVYATEDPAINKSDIEAAVVAKLTQDLGGLNLGQAVYTSFINKSAFMDGFGISYVVVNSPIAPGVTAAPGELLNAQTITVRVVYV